MAGVLISDYGLNDHWTELLESIEKARKGKIALSLTNYDNDSLPAIAAGGYVEIAGALYGFSSEEAIGGSPTTANINYIVVDPTPITASWSIVAPTWSPSKNGWYDAGEAKRYVAGCYYVDTPTYRMKSIFYSRDSIAIRYANLSLVGFPGASIYTNGGSINFTANGDAYIPVNLSHGAVVTELYSYAPTLGDGTITINLFRSSNTSIGIGSMAENIHSGTGALSDTSISFAIIDNENYQYFVRATRANEVTEATISAIRIKYTMIKPLP